MCRTIPPPNVPGAGSVLDPRSIAREVESREHRWLTRDDGGQRPLQKEGAPSVTKSVSAPMSCFQPVHPAMLAVGSQLSGWFPLTNVAVSDTTPPVTL